MQAVKRQLTAEQMRPLLPNLHLGTSGGAFGVGPGDDLNRLEGRADLNVILSWEIENMGAGNRARRHERASQTRSARMNVARIRDQISNNVTMAFHNLNASEMQRETAQGNLANASDVMS